MDRLQFATPSWSSIYGGCLRHGRVVQYVSNLTSLVSGYREDEKDKQNKKSSGMAHDGNDGRSESLTDSLDAPMSVLTTISSFIAISWYNVAVVNVVLLLVFRRWSGLYFYSLLITSWGIVLHQLGFLLQFFGLVQTFAEWYVLMMVGWYSMTTGQAVVLYSRLHLMVRDTRKYRWILYMIFINVLLFHIPTTVFLAMTDTNPHLVPAFDIWQNIHVTAFSVQEFIIAGLYIYEARQILNPATGFCKGRIQMVMRNLIYVNLLIIILDIIVMCIQYAGMYEIHVVIKGAAYSVKLFVEFFVLNQLIEVTRAGVQSTRDELPKSPYRATGRVATSIPQTIPHSHISTKRSAREDGEPLGYTSFAESGENSAPDLSHQSHVYRTMEVIVTSEDNEQSRPGGVMRRREDWIELE